MSEPWLPRETGSAVVLTALGSEYGVTPQVLLEGTGLDVAALHNPQTQIAASQELQIVRNLVAAVPLPGLGLIAGRRYNLGIHPEWGYALTTSRTLREALDVGLTYAELTYTFSRLERVDVGTEVGVRIDDSSVPADLRRFLMERDLVAAFWISTIAVGGPPPLRTVSFRYERPTDPQVIEAYVDLIGVEPAWGAPENILTCDAALLDRSLGESIGVEIADLARRACGEALALRKQRTGFVGQVREAVMTAPPAASQAEIASQLHVSLRTLRRRLADEGTTYREVAQETLGSLAEELLAGGVTVEQVADRLGYASPSSFTRAFKAWRGVSPGTFGRTSREARASRDESTR